jgi:para-nitrobenzyl esterase
VTVFGESAGSMSVATLLGIPRARGLFQRAIMQSGAANFISTPDRGAELVAGLFRTLDLSARHAERLWTLPTDVLLQAQQKAFPRLGAADGLPFQPIIDADVLPLAPLAAIGNGAAADIPILIGTNLDEMKLFGLFDPAFGTLDEEGLRRRAERVLAGHAQAVIAAYRSARAARGESVTPTDLWYAIDSDRTFRYPATQLAERQRVHQADVYAYLFVWPSPLLGGRIGAGHAVELPFVFGTLEEPLIAPFAGHGDDALTLATIMQDAWIAFAHGGTPGHPGLPAWERYDATTRHTMLLGAPCALAAAPREPERVLWERLA